MWCGCAFYEKKSCISCLLKQRNQNFSRCHRSSAISCWTAAVKRIGLGRARPPRVAERTASTGAGAPALPLLPKPHPPPTKYEVNFPVHVSFMSLTMHFARGCPSNSEAPSRGERFRTGSVPYPLVESAHSALEPITSPGTPKRGRQPTPRHEHDIRQNRSEFSHPCPTHATIATQEARPPPPPQPP